MAKKRFIRVRNDRIKYRYNRTASKKLKQHGKLVI